MLIDTWTGVAGSSLVISSAVTRALESMLVGGRSDAERLALDTPEMTWNWLRLPVGVGLAIGEVPIVCDVSESTRPNGREWDAETRDTLTGCCVTW